MGGGSQGGDSGTQTSIQDLVQQMQRQQMYSQIGQGIQKAGSIIGQQQPYMQGGSQGVPQAGAQSQGASPIVGPYMPSQGMGGGGIDPQQLALILQRLGYGGQGI